MKHFIFTILFLMFSCTSLASTNYQFNNYTVQTKVCTPVKNVEALKLAAKVSKLKDKYHLEYKDDEDLYDTCDHIVRYSKYSKFDKYDLAAICLKESKFKPTAHNKADGGKGLFQITKPGIWWKEELFWYNKPYSKDQNIKAAIIILESNLKQYKTKAKAIQRYNGTCYKSKMYQKAVVKLKQEIKAVQV